MGLDDGVLVVRRIEVVYTLKLDLEKREAAERAHRLHVDRCPVARTLRDCVEIGTTLQMEDLG